MACLLHRQLHVIDQERRLLAVVLFGGEQQRNCVARKPRHIERSLAIWHRIQIRIHIAFRIVDRNLVPLLVLYRDRQRVVGFGFGHLIRGDAKPKSQHGGTCARWYRNRLR